MVATQTFDDNKTPSISWLNIAKTNMKRPEVAEMKLNGEVTISLPKSDKNQKRVYIFPWMIIIKRLMIIKLRQFLG